jgi:hypothetical protein
MLQYFLTIAGGSHSFCHFFACSRGGHFFKRELRNYCFQLLTEGGRLAEPVVETPGKHAALTLAERLSVVVEAILNAQNLRCVEPLNTLAFLPQPIFRFFALRRVNAETMLFAARPLARILTAISPRVKAIAMLFVVRILARVLATVRPRILTNAMHIVIDPLAFELSAIDPFVNAKTLDLILIPFAVEGAPISPPVDAATMLLPFIVFALVVTSVDP